MTSVITLCGCLLACAVTVGADKNGVSPQVISLPTGPGSISGLGESFQPQLNSGSGAYSIPIQVPKGPGGLAPALSLQYHTGNGNGCVGIGWKLSGPTMISRNMDAGLPLYVDAANGVDDDFDGVIDNSQELDQFSGLDLEELVALPDATFRGETETRFLRYERVGAGWRARSKNGVLHEFGTTSAARIEDGPRVFSWLIERTTDLNGNTIEYRYVSDPASPGQKYCREIRWAGTTAFYGVVLHYEDGRPDVHSDFRSGFEVRTALRLVGLDVIAQGVPVSPGALTGDLNEDGQPDFLIRHYALEYEPKGFHSLLRRVTMLGSDGVTALPPMTFAYTEWVAPNNVSSSMGPSTGDPMAALSSNDVEVIDMNRDGLPDLLEATSAVHRVYLNLGVNTLGRLAWDTVGTLVGNAPGLNLGSPAVHLADHSADGESDLINKVNDSLIQCHINTGQRTWQNPVTLGNTDTWPRWPFENAGSRTLDTDHNRMHDILFTSDNSYRLWMLMPGGRYGKEVPLPVLSDGTQAFSFEKPGARIADVNGDRISDLVWIQSTRVVYWASCGRGNFEGPINLLLSGMLSTTEIARTDFADVNGDGLPDLILVRPDASPTSIDYQLNRGRAGFDVRRRILGLPTTVGGDATRWVDMNGNGSVDLLISNSARSAGTREQYLDFVPGVRPHLLRRIDNGLGRVTTLEYESSVQQMVRARTAGQPWTSTMPISVPVVARIAEDDSRGNQYTTEFTYRDPYYHPVKQEFRGFSQAQVKELGDASAPTKVVVHVFDTGDGADCRKGRPLAQEVVTESNSRFERVENTVQHRVLDEATDGRQVCFVFTEATDVNVFEQTSNPVHIRTEFQYDDFGNLLQENKHGIVGQNGDEVLVEKAFAYDPDIWLMDRVTRSTTRDGSGTKLAEDLFTYDDRGNLTQQRRWLDVGDRYILTVRNEYDAFGNITRITDANNHSRSFTYDPLLHAYPVSETVHLQASDLVMTAAYDLGYGTIISASDFSGAESTLRYDALGRLTAIQRPGGAQTDYEYDLGNPVSRVVTRIRETADGGTHDSYDYVDGLSRPLGSKVEATDGRWRFLDAVTFNARGLVGGKWLPYYTTTPDYEQPDAGQSFESMTYDSRDRVIQTTNPDGTFTRTVFEPLAEHSFDELDNAGAGTPTTRRFDGLARMVEVIERNGGDNYHTQYTWDALGNLTIMTDALGNQRLYAYDSLKRKTMTNDPDRGVMTYAYDDVGNLVQTTDARGQVIDYAYDEANRLVSEDYAASVSGDDPIDVVYRYDTPSAGVPLGDGTVGTAAFTGGRLASVADRSGEEHLSYDARGNIAWTTKRIRDPRLGVLASYTTQFTHDLMNRVVGVIYPDNDRAHLVYNEGGFLGRLDGGNAGRAVVDAADHEAAGQLSEIRFGNGVQTAYSYDSRDRLASLTTAPASAASLIDYAYTYDPVSNLTQVLDRRPTASVPDSSPRRNTQEMLYDDLYRLREMRFGSEQAQTAGVLTYEFDPIGNLTQQSASGGIGGSLAADPFVNHGLRAFGGSGGSTGRVGRGPGEPPGPHALTSTAAGATLEYDDNGNVLALDGAHLVWDEKNRLSEYRKGKLTVRYTYDYADKRVSRATTDGDRHEETLYVGQYFELRPNDAPIKYVFSGPTRIAQLKGTLDPTRPRLQRFRLAAGWNLITLSVDSAQTASQVLGADARVYRWVGTQYVSVNLGQPLPLGEAVWVEVPAVRVVSALGAYDDTSESIPLPAGQQFSAWPRLEPFRPDVYGATDARVTYYDASAGKWLLIDPQLPAGVADPIDAAPSASGLWITVTAPTMLLPANTSAEDILVYHADHLGSAAAVTDAAGDLRTETAYYPFGLPRLVYEPNGSAMSPYGFAGKEHERETGLQDFGKRDYVPHLGVFTRPDPQFVEFTDLAQGDASDQESYRRFLQHPQMSNLYSYAAGNPLRYVDLDGREIEISEVLRKDVPLFKKAWKLLESTNEGQRILKSLGGKDIKVYIRASLPDVKDAKVGKGIGVAAPGFVQTGQQYTGSKGEGANLKANEYAVLLNVKATWEVVRTREDYVYKLAEDIFHELRHAEGDYVEQHPITKRLEGAFGAIGFKYDAYKQVHNNLDKYLTPSADASLAQFQSELGALRASGGGN